MKWYLKNEATATTQGSTKMKQFRNCTSWGPAGPPVKLNYEVILMKSWGPCQGDACCVHSSMLRGRQSPSAGTKKGKLEIGEPILSVVVSTVASLAPSQHPSREPPNGLA